MKRTIILIALTSIFAWTAAVSLAQDKEIVRQERSLPEFNGIIVGGAFEVYIEQGSPQKVEVETESRFIDNVITKVNGSNLEISSKGLKNVSKLNVYVTAPIYKSIETSGAAEIKGGNTLTTDEMKLTASGASEMKLNLDVDHLVSSVSGAAEMKLEGRAGHHKGNASGASTLSARNLVTQQSDMTVSGAASAHVYATEVLDGDVSGAGDLDYVGNPKNNLVYVKKSSVHASSDDSVHVKLGGMDIEVKEGPDTVRIRAGNRVIIVDEDGDIKYERTKKYKFNGHWAGFDIGLNGYVNGDYNMNFPKEYEYLDLRMEKSVAIGLNFFEQNIRLAKNQKWGMVTGLGLGFNNYRFLHPTRLSMDSSNLQGYLYDGISIRKSKLSIMYLTLPVLFEFQTNPWCKKNSFHIAAGMIMSTRLMSHTKVYYNEYNKDYTLTQYNPVSGSYQPVYTSTSPNYAKVHDYGDWYLKPFKFDATVRIGWGVINLFATVSVNELFREGRGPELYPWSAGISLVNF